MSRFKRGLDYPNEGFVQRAIEKHFAERGFRAEQRPPIDLYTVDPTSGERWHVEAKGMSTSPGLDFHTGLGQILTRINDPTTKYAVAVPRDERFLKQCAKVPDWVCRRLNLHFLVVDSTGRVTELQKDPRQERFSELR